MLRVAPKTVAITGRCCGPLIFTAQFDRFSRLRSARSWQAAPLHASGVISSHSSAKIQGIYREICAVKAFETSPVLGAPKARSTQAVSVRTLGKSVGSVREKTARRPADPLHRPSLMMKRPANPRNRIHALQLPLHPLAKHGWSNTQNGGSKLDADNPV